MTGQRQLAHTVGRILHSLWWYVREVSGENHYPRYVERCARDGETHVMSRRDFERQRHDARA